MKIDKKRLPDLLGFENLAGLKSENLNVQSISRDFFVIRFGKGPQTPKAEALDSRTNFGLAIRYATLSIIYARVLNERDV